MNYLFYVLLIFTPLMLVGQTDSTTGARENYTIYNRCSHLTIGQQGDTVSTAFCAKYRTKVYSFQTTYVNNKPFALRVYCNAESQVAEFWYNANEWKKVDYHSKSVSFSNSLLKIYMKKKNNVHYDQLWYE